MTTTTDALAQPGAQELLRTALLARIAYAGTDGFPRVVPIGFHWTGESIVVCTATTAPKVRALAERPHVAVVVDAGDSPATARSLTIRGVATLETVDGVPDEYLAGTAKSLDGIDPSEFERAVRATYSQMVRITIAPRWARFHDFGAGRLPGYLAELVGGA